MGELEILVESADGTDLSKEKSSQCLICCRPQKMWLEFVFKFVSMKPFLDQASWIMSNRLRFRIKQKSIVIKSKLADNLEDSSILRCGCLAVMVPMETSCNIWGTQLLHSSFMVAESRGREKGCFTVGFFLTVT